MGSASRGLAPAVPTRAPRSRGPSLRRTRNLESPVRPVPVFASGDAPMFDPAVDAHVHMDRWMESGPIF
eukprot:7461707-Heterocapsa_arctica.AAC.1